MIKSENFVQEREKKIIFFKESLLSNKKIFFLLFGCENGSRDEKKYNKNIYQNEN